jgi:hypothetical protein
MKASYIFSVLILILFCAGVSFAGTTYSGIQKMSGWQSCTYCAGGPGAAYSLREYINPPSLDGAAAQFNLGGSRPYGNALWWRQLGGNSSASNFTYDLYFYLKAPWNSQALEFDVNQSVAGRKFIFGTQCDYKNSHQWDVWDTAHGRWVSTGIACSVPQVYTWNHLTWQFQRVNGQARFVALTLNGVTHYVNRYFWPAGSSAYEVNVAFQMDGDYAQHAYSAWLDKVSLTYW